MTRSSDWIANATTNAAIDAPGHVSVDTPIVCFTALTHHVTVPGFSQL